MLARLRVPRIIPQMADLVAWSLDQAKPRPRQVDSRPQRYADSVSHAWPCYRDLSAQVPRPGEVNRYCFARDLLRFVGSH